MRPRKVVVTGIGIVSPLGLGKESFLNALKNGRSGIGSITRFDASDFPVQIAGEIKDDLSPFFDPKEQKRYDLFTQYAIVASILALEDAELQKNVDPYNVGVIIASGIGGIGTIEEEHSKLLEKGPNRVSPFLIPRIISNMASGCVAMKFGFKGPNFSVASACASASHAIGAALDLIRYGKADVILAGGTEAPITPLSVAGFASMKALSTRNSEPEKASRPFDAERDGFVMSEAAAVLVLESEETALKRGARIYCELAGYGFTDDAYHITQPDLTGETGARTMQLAMKDAGLSPEEVDYINAHGTSTRYNDEIETRAIKIAFGEHAYRLKVSSIKSMVGHTLGAAGAVEAASTALTIHAGVIFPTINLENPDPECDLDYVPNKAVMTEVSAALSNSFGFGGHNACLAFKRYEY
jgi:3-oxoacyl-[acyl-carrier-protein] synthase II